MIRRDQLKMIAAQKFVSKTDPGTIHEASDALETGQISSVELCQNLIRRYDDVDDNINGFLSLDASQVLEDANASDASRKNGTQLSRYDGIPIAIKDNLSVKGQTCGCASKILEGFKSPYNATVINNLQKNGVICFGRTNMDEFAMGSTTEFSAYKKTSNPWDISRVPGGSSGGSAAVVSSGQALAALGSDTGGSIRQPASFCGVVGLKPTYGRVSRYGLVAFASSLDQIGPITRDVEDAAILLELISGRDELDSTSLPNSNFNHNDVGNDFDISSVRIGIPKEFREVEGLSPEVNDAFEKSISVFKSRGCDIVDVNLPNIAYAVSSYYIIATAEASSNLSRFDGIRYGNRIDRTSDLLDIYLDTRENGFREEVKRRILLGTYVLSSGYYDAYYLRAQKMRTLIREDFSNAFRSCDLMLSPVSPISAYPFGSISDPLQVYLSDIYTIPVNLAGNCAVSIPASFDGDGMPIGIQLIGNSMDEIKLLQAARWFEIANEMEKNDEV